MAIESRKQARERAAAEKEAAKPKSADALRALIDSALAEIDEALAQPKLEFK